MNRLSQRHLSESHHQGTRRLLIRRLLAAIGIALAVVGLVLTGIALAAQRPAPQPARQFGAGPVVAAAPNSASATAPAPRSASSAGGSRRPAASPSATRKRSSTDKTVTALDESSPTSISIPAIGVHTGFESLGLLSDGQMQTPTDPAKVGWFTGAHTPGAAGVSVVAGHVTWNGSESAFFKLGRLHHGDHITIHRQDGSNATFAVDRMGTFPKTQFPADQVYGYATQPELVLITCGGTYSSTRHYYDSNVIAWAHIVSVSR